MTRCHGVLVFLPVAAAFVFDAATHQLRESVLEALEACGYGNGKHDAVAVLIHVARQRLSLQLNGHDPLTCLWRLFVIDGFGPKFIKIHGKKLGVEVIDSPELRRLLAGLVRLEKRVSKMGRAIPIEQERRRA